MAKSDCNCGNGCCVVSVLKHREEPRFYTCKSLAYVWEYPAANAYSADYTSSAISEQTVLGYSGVFRITQEQAQAVRRSWSEPVRWYAEESGYVRKYPDARFCDDKTGEINGGGTSWTEFDCIKNGHKQLGPGDFRPKEEPRFYSSDGLMFIWEYPKGVHYSRSYRTDGCQSSSTEQEVKADHNCFSITPAQAQAIRRTWTEAVRWYQNKETGRIYEFPATRGYHETLVPEGIKVPVSEKDCILWDCQPLSVREAQEILSRWQPAGRYASCPDSAPLVITGDISVRWTSPSLTPDSEVLAKLVKAIDPPSGITCELHVSRLKDENARQAKEIESLDRMHSEQYKTIAEFQKSDLEQHVQINDLTQKIRGENEVVRGLQGKVNRQAQTITQLQTQVMELKDTLVTKSEKIKQLEDDADELVDDAHERISQIDELQEELTKLKSKKKNGQYECADGRFDLGDTLWFDYSQPDKDPEEVVVERVEDMAWGRRVWLTEGTYATPSHLYVNKPIQPKKKQGQYECADGRFNIGDTLWFRPSSRSLDPYQMVVSRVDAKYGGDQVWFTSGTWSGSKQLYVNKPS